MDVVCFETIYNNDLHLDIIKVKNKKCYLTQEIRDAIALLSNLTDKMFSVFLFKILIHF